MRSIVLDSYVCRGLSHWKKLPTIHGPLYGRALQVAVMMIPIVACIFARYVWTHYLKPPQRNPQPIEINSKLECVQSFLKAYRPSSDTKDLFIVRDQAIDDGSSDAPILHLPPEMLAEVVSKLSDRENLIPVQNDLKNLHLTSKRFHTTLVQYLPANTHEREVVQFIEHHHLSVDETQFRTIPIKIRYQLFLRLCQQLGCSLENRDRIYPVASEEFILYFLRRLGPFTFLTIPTVPDFQSAPIAPIERCTKDGKMQFRFYFEDSKGNKYTQEIAQQQDNSWQTSNQNGFWTEGYTLQERDIYRLLSFLRNEPDNRTRRIGLYRNLDPNLDRNPNRSADFVRLRLVKFPSV